MFNSTFNKTILSTLAAVVVVTNFSVNPSYAGGGGGDEKYSSISTTNSGGSTTSIRSRNGAKTFTLTRTKNGKVVSKKRVKKARKPFITIFNPDGTSRTVTTPSKRPDSATRHFPDGSTHTVIKPVRPRTAFVTIHNPDGTSRTVTSPGR